MIYLWKIPKYYKNRDMGEYDRDISPNNYNLTKGQILSDFSPIPVVRFEIPKNNLLKFDCLPNDTLIPLVNEKIRNLLQEQAPDDVQFFPAKLICADGEQEGYSFLNITRLITGIDHEKSICLKMDNFKGGQFITGFHYLTYLKDCMGKYQLARDKEYPDNLLVNEKVKLLFEKEKITGVYLAKPEDYYRPLGELL